MSLRPTKLALLSALALSPVFLSACIIVDADDHVASNWDMDRDYGSLKGADVAANQVSSNGCTTKDFIGADVRKQGEDRFSVGFFREKEDYCRAYLPEGVALTWSFEELGIPDGAEVTVRNKIAS